MPLHKDISQHALQDHDRQNDDQKRPRKETSRHERDGSAPNRLPPGAGFPERKEEIRLQSPSLCVRWSVIDKEPVAGAARRLQMQRIGWVALDFAAQTVHLNINGTLVRGNARTGEDFPRNGFTRVLREKPQHCPLPVRQSYDLAALAQFSARKVECKLAKMN